MPRPSEGRLEIGQPEAIGEYALGRGAAELANALTGHDRYCQPISRIRQINLGAHQLCRPLRNDCLLLRPQIPAGFYAEQHQIRRSDIAAAHFYTEAIDLLRSIPKPSRIGQPDGPAEEIGMSLNRIPSGAGDLSHESTGAPEKGVEKRRLPDVGTSREYQEGTFAKPLG
jgi:hypothetical protein